MIRSATLIRGVDRINNKRQRKDRRRYDKLLGHRFARLSVSGWMYGSELALNASVHGWPIGTSDFKSCLAWVVRVLYVQRTPLCAPRDGHRIVIHLGVGGFC